MEFLFNGRKEIAIAPDDSVVTLADLLSWILQNLHPSRPDQLVIRDATV